MNEKIYNAEKTLSNRLQRQYKLFVQDSYGTWQNTINGASGYAYVQENIMWSYCYYTAGVKHNASVTSRRTIPRLKSAKSIKFKALIYRVATNVTSYSGWEGYFKLCNGFFNVYTCKGLFAIYVNDVLVANYAEKVMHDIEIKQDCFYLNGVRYNFPNGAVLASASGNECVSYAWMGNLYGLYSYGAKLYVQPQDLIVTW